MFPYNFSIENEVITCKIFNKTELLPLDSILLPPPLKAIIYIKHYVEQGILRSLTKNFGSFCIDAINNFI